MSKEYTAYSYSGFKVRGTSYPQGRWFVWTLAIPPKNICGVPVPFLTSDTIMSHRAFTIFFPFSCVAGSKLNTRQPNRTVSLGGLTHH